MYKLYVGDVGTEVIVWCGDTDISAATDLALKVKKPDGTTVTWTPSIHETYYLKYVIQSGDLDMAGIYYLQSSFTLSGWSGLGETAEFEVFAPFE